MRTGLLVLPVTAGLLMAATAVTTAAARPARNTAGPGALTAVAPDPARTVLLINGDRIMAAPGTGRRSVTVLPAGAGLGGSLLTLGAGGVTYEIPAAAVPFLGRGLDPGLFSAGGLLREERGGRVPVRVAYRGRRPALPGVTLTRARGGVAAAYLTASSARVFGAALARQFAADHSRGSYGRDGMFAGGVLLSLAGTAPSHGRRAAVLVQATPPRYVLHTLTVTGTDLAGGPDTGGFVMVTNADNSSRFFEGATFHHGTVKMSVPAGHHWAAGVFTDATHKGGRPTQRMVILPQFTVAKDATVGVDERTATSRITVATPRPSRALDTPTSTCSARARRGPTATPTSLLKGRRHCMSARPRGGRRSAGCKRSRRGYGSSRGVRRAFPTSTTWSTPATAGSSPATSITWCGQALWPRCTRASTPTYPAPGSRLSSACPRRWRTSL